MASEPAIAAYIEPEAQRPFASVDVEFPDGTRLEYVVEPNGDYDLWADHLAPATLAQVVRAGRSAIEKRWGHAE